MQAGEKRTFRRAGPLQPANAVGNVVGQVTRVSVHPYDHHTARPRNAKIQGARHDALRVVGQLDQWVATGVVGTTARVPSSLMPSMISTSSRWQGYSDANSESNNGPMYTGSLRQGSPRRRAGPIGGGVAQGCRSGTGTDARTPQGTCLRPGGSLAQQAARVLRLARGLAVGNPPISNAKSRPSKSLDLWHNSCHTVAAVQALLRANLSKEGDAELRD